jgi:hypothetical protein
MPNITIKLKSIWNQGVRASLSIFDQLFLKDLTVRVLLGISLAMLALIWIFSFFNFDPTDYLVPLRYDSFLGVTSLGAWYQLYAVPLILVLLFCLNVFLASTAYVKDKLVSYILLGSNIFLAICGGTVIISLSAIISR